MAQLPNGSSVTIRTGDPEPVRVTRRVMHAYLVEIGSDDVVLALRAAAEWLVEHPDVSVTSITHMPGEASTWYTMLTVEVLPSGEEALDDEVLNHMAVGADIAELAPIRPGGDFVSRKKIRMVRPGDLVRAFLNQRDMSTLTLAVRCGFQSAQGGVTLEGIIAGYVEVTPEMASHLSIGTGIPAGFWLSLEDCYRDMLEDGI